MRVNQISIKALVTSLLILFGVTVILLSVIASFQFRDAALESQAKSLSRSIEVAATEIVKQMDKQAVDLGRGAQKASAFRKGVKKMGRDGVDMETQKQLVAHLNDQFHQRYVTAGILVLKKLRVYDLAFNLLAESSEGMSGFPKTLPDFLMTRARDRKGGDRYKTISGFWMTPEGPMYSVLGPVGGLRLYGYIEVVVEPSYNLHQVEKMMKAPLLIYDATGKALFKTENWDETKDHEVIELNYDIPTEKGAPALRLSVLENVEALHTRIRNTQLVIIGVFGLVIAFGIGTALWVLTRYLFRPIKALVSNVELCAEGDLTVDVKRHGLRELYVFSGALVTLVDKLRKQVEEIQSDANEVAEAAEQLSTDTQHTKQGMAQQQSETEQLATAINEMTSTVQEVARSAAQAASGAHKADDEANKGRQVVTATVSAINDLAQEVEQAATVINGLEKESESISTVLDVIRGIAEQTNLLALNAAIEAARAGDQGRGFAVVADEVRTLASRTQQSTQEIQKMVESFQNGTREAVLAMEKGSEKAQVGVEQAAHAGESLEAIVEAVDNINEMNTQIASASEEQGAVAEEINRNVISISEVTAETAKSSQRTSLSSEKLTALAENLREIVSRFKV